VNRPYRPTAVRTRAAWGPNGELLALVADGPDPLAFLDVPEGQPALTREQIDEHIATLDADGLAALIEAARAEAEQIDPATVTSEDVDRINLLGDAVESAEGRQTAIANEEQERQQAAQDALARLRRPAEGEEEHPEGAGAPRDERARRRRRPRLDRAQHRAVDHRPARPRGGVRGPPRRDPPRTRVRRRR
jgi:hypothetical protein